MPASYETTYVKKEKPYEKVRDVDAVIVRFCIVGRLYGYVARDVMIAIR